MPTKQEKIKQFWKEQAETFKTSPLATAPDTFYRELEIKNIISHLKNGVSILDVGCGNGFSTFKFAAQFPKSQFVGLDYSTEMIEQADKELKKHPKAKITFTVGDVLRLSATESLGNQKFDLIISERCLINLLNWDEQKKALLEMKKRLKPKGRIILCENTHEGLLRLNTMRAVVDLPPIEVRWHNFYFPEKKFLSFAPKHFRVKEITNIGSMYYLVSRVIYAQLCVTENKQPDYLNPINQIAAQLPTVGDWSPNYIFILENKK